jgi:hypothetical protein
MIRIFLSSTLRNTKRNPSFGKGVVVDRWILLLYLVATNHKIPLAPLHKG